jgi:hypothetical protein
MSSKKQIREGCAWLLLAPSLTPSAMDPNTWTPEYKAFLVKLEKA